MTPEEAAIMEGKQTEILNGDEHFKITRIKSYGQTNKKAVQVFLCRVLFLPSHPSSAVLSV